MRLLAVLLLVAGCTPIEECGPASCTGCCTSDGACVAGDALNACGAGGNACDVCTLGQRCSGKCMTECVGEADAQLCVGAGARCGQAQVKDRCGVERSVECGVCPSGETCRAGQCCTPETDAQLCAAQGVQCGRIQVQDRCGVARDAGCGSCAYPSTCMNGSCTCEPESDAAFCARAGKTCGAWMGRDNCGLVRTVASCGGCTAPQTCLNGLCGCQPMTDAALCASKGKACGSLTAVDNCGATRSVASCGGCVDGNLCNAGVCACGETEASFCFSHRVSCGPASGTDRCGNPRNVASCGSCTAPQTCGGGGQPGVCGCTESTADFCRRLGKDCGTWTARDACGVTRTVACGTCTAPQTCGGGGSASVCGCTPADTVAQLCARASSVCGPTTVTDSCGVVRTVQCGSCASGESCTSGQCRCEAPSAVCAGVCTDVTRSSTHCGFCGFACPATQSCNSGACGCGAGLSLCGATCVNQQDDESNCGACGRRCQASSTCQAGACVCDPGTTACGPACVDVTRDAQNCGACGRACAGNESCLASTCVASTPPLLPARYANSAVLLQDAGVMSVGGVFSSSTTDAGVDVLSVTANTWTPIEATPAVRVRSPAVAVAANGEVYSFSTSGSRSWTAATGWVTASPPPVVRERAAAAASADGRVFVIGGARAGYCTDSSSTRVDVYLPGTNTWGTAPPLPEGRSEATAVVLDNKLYVFGGVVSGRATNQWGDQIETCLSTGRVDVFDLLGGTWRTTTSSPPMTGHGAAALNGRIYLAGGATFNTWPYADASLRAAVYEFNPVSGQYKTLAPLPQARVHFALVAHPNGFLYAVGGSNKYAWGSSLYPLSTSFVWMSAVPRYSIALDRWIP